MEEKYQMKVLFDIRDFNACLSTSKKIEIAVKCSDCAIIILSKKFLKSVLCQQQLRQCLIEQEQNPSFEVFLISAEEKGTLLTDIKQIVPGKIPREIIKERCLDYNHPQLMDKLVSKMRAKKSDEHVTDNGNATQTRDTFRHNTCSR